MATLGLLEDVPALPSWALFRDFVGVCDDLAVVGHLVLADDTLWAFAIFGYPFWVHFFQSVEGFIFGLWQRGIYFPVCSYGVHRYTIYTIIRSCLAGWEMLKPA